MSRECSAASSLSPARRLHLRAYGAPQLPGAAQQWLIRGRNRPPHRATTSRLGASAQQPQNQQQQRPGGGSAADGEWVDTRIHWDSPDEGWIEGDSVRQRPAATSEASRGPAIWPISRDLVMAIMEVESSHYKVLGVTPTADVEAVKVAYRRLSKLYHPDTTELPLELAEQKFVQLREAYSVLSSSEQRKLYDWKIASETTQNKGQRFVWPYEVDQSQRGPGSRSPAPLDRKRPQQDSNMDENGNVPISDGSMAALTFDLFAIFVAIATIALASYLKS